MKYDKIDDVVTNLATKLANETTLTEEQIVEIGEAISTAAQYIETPGLEALAHQEMDHPEDDTSWADDEAPLGTIQ